MRNEYHMNYLRRKTADEAELWAADRIEELERKVASRDAEVVSLTNQRDYEYVRAENAEQERDQLREQVKILRCERDVILKQMASENRWPDYSIEALAATEPSREDRK